MLLKLPSNRGDAPSQISKLITHSHDRSAALSAMRRALDSYVIRGVQHNTPLLRSVLDVPAFVEGNLSTAFLAETFPTVEDSAPCQLPLTQQQEDEMLALAVMLWLEKEQQLAGDHSLQVSLL